MAFSIGTISYTISKLISVFNLAELSPRPTRNDLSILDRTTQNLPNTNEVVFDDQKVAEIFGQTMALTDSSVGASTGNMDQKSIAEKTETADDTLIARISEFSTPPVELKEAVSVEEPAAAPAERYEEVTITEYFLKYNQDYGDLNNLRMRNNFVFNQAKLRNRTNKRTEKTQKDDNEIAHRQKTERVHQEEKRINDLKVQREFAEKYTKLISDKD